MRFVSNRAMRLLLSISVSIWMAGGCVLGCSAMGAEASQPSENAVVTGASCHEKAAHHCCSTAKPKKQTVRTSAQQLPRIPTFTPAPRGSMKDCPLAVNSTATTSKSSTYLPEPARGPVAALPSFEKQSELLYQPAVAPFLPNRGPTHVLVCVFLI